MRTGDRLSAVRKRRRKRRILITASVVLLFATLFVAIYHLSTGNGGAAAFQAFTDHYLSIMKNLNSSETKARMALELDGKFNFTDLFNWEHSKLTFAEDPAGWFEDPIDILREGKGICEQFSIVYVSACLALGYQSRLVVAANTSTWSFIHVWAEDYFNGNWIPVDPSDKVWDQPSRYQQWDWGRYIGLGVKIYAFEDGKFVDVTSTYE
jgi:hypothetical protein